MQVTSAVYGAHYVLGATRRSVLNVLAAALLDVRHRMSKPAHAYLE